MVPDTDSMSFRRTSNPKYLSEINVTPFVDVMLVLLVIFMVTAPMLVTGVEVDLPDANARDIASDDQPLQISVDAQQNIYLGESQIPREQFPAVIVNLALSIEEPARQRVFVRADQSIAYGDVMRLVSLISEAGFTKVAFVSVPASEQEATVAQ